MSTTMVSTKLVVHDLERSAAFYREAYGFEERGRVQAEIDGEPIDEILLGRDGDPGIPLMLVKYLERSAPPQGEVLLVFSTDDLDALCDRVRGAGGRVVAEPYDSTAAPVRAAFTTDPEGHWIENVQVTGAAS